MLDQRATVADQYLVLVNHEEQYSIWPAEKAIPAGWNAVGGADSKQACLDRIEALWTDMRPLSLRTASQS